MPHSGSVLSSLGREVADYESSKGAIKSWADASLPRSLLGILVDARLAENTQYDERRAVQIGGRVMHISERRAIAEMKPVLR